MRALGIATKDPNVEWDETSLSVPHRFIGDAVSATLGRRRESDAGRKLSVDSKRSSGTPPTR